MQTILITWWVWYIWAHGVVQFEQAWYKTIIVDNLSNSQLNQIEWIKKILWYIPKFYQIDLKDKQDLEKVFEENKIDWVIHFAWWKAVWESCKKTIDYFQNNITWSINLFELMEKYNVKKIIFSSSATVYNQEIFDKKDFSWAKEKDLIWNTTNPYGTTKYVIEKLLKDLATFLNFSVIILRYFNPVWTHKSWYIWESPKWIPNNLLPYIMKVANWELKYLNVFWDDYDTEDGTWKRDYIDVNDLIFWHIKAYEKIKNINDWFFEIYNLWTWKSISVLEMIKIAEKITWQKIPYKIAAKRQWDLANVYCNPQKAEKELNWKATTSLEESLKNAWKFYNN